MYLWYLYHILEQIPPTAASYLILFEGTLLSAVKFDRGSHGSASSSPCAHAFSSVTEHGVVLFLPTSTSPRWYLVGGYRSQSPQTDTVRVFLLGDLAPSRPTRNDCSDGNEGHGDSTKHQIDLST